MQYTNSLLVALFAALLFQGATKYKVVTRYPVPGDGGFDYVGIDSSARRLYLSHATQVDVVNADNGKVVGTIPDTPGVHGAVVASEFKHGFTSNGRENKVSMFNPATLEVIKKIASYAIMSAAWSAHTLVSLSNARGGSSDNLRRWLRSIAATNCHVGPGVSRQGSLSCRNRGCP
jgi:hypothetical protein